jgi:hypothetical protein
VLLLLQGELLHEMVGLLVHVLRQLLDLLKQNRLPPLQISFLTGYGLRVLLRIWIRDPVLYLTSGPGYGISLSGSWIPTTYSESLVTIFWVTNTYFVSIGTNFFCTFSKIKLFTIL